VRSERVRQKPEAGAAGERVLDAGFSVAVKFTGNWALVCRDGVKMGYVPQDAILKVKWLLL
jgi:hypothetical protein